MLDASAKQGILKPIRLVLVDRQPIVLQGLKSVLGTQQDFDVVASASDGASCLEAIRTLSPDVALIADTLQDLTASDILAIAKAEKLSTRLVFFVESDANHGLAAAIAAGACSVISKYVAPGPMLRSLRLMAKSGVSLEQTDLVPGGEDGDGGSKLEKMLELLTPRERQIVRLVAEGMSNKEIARRLDVSQGTVKVHLHNIFQKLEITNRTVLATLSWLQRTSGFSALALAFLAFAIADELKASDANDMLANDDGPGQTAEQAGYEVWKKAILQRFIVSESGETFPLAARDLLAKASQATNPATAMEALRAAEQFLGSRPWKDGAAVGSGAPSLAALLQREANDTPTAGDLTAENHLPRSVVHPTSIPGGYATFAALAGALIYTLNDSHHGAQARELDQASIDSFLTGTGDDAATKLAAITHVDADRAENSAPHFLPHDDGRPSGPVTGSGDLAHQGVQGETGRGAAGDIGQGDNGHRIDGVLNPGDPSGPGGDGRDQLMDGNVENVVHRGSSDSKSSSSDTADVVAEPDRLNLAAFGALAYLHLTAAAKFIPPHTLAWIYDPASNQTIVYVNPTDHILEIGDRGLLEIHLQGIVSVADLDVVHQSDGAVVAVTLEQLEQALIPVTASDEAASSTDSIHGSGSALGAVWSALADDNSSFQFARVGTGSGTPAKSGAFTRAPTDRTEDSAGESSASASASPIVAGHGGTPPTVENPTSKSEPANARAPSTTQNEMVPPGLQTADSVSRGNSDHASDPGPERVAEKTEADSKSHDGAGKDKEHHSQAADNSPGGTNAPQPSAADHGNSGHSASGKAAEAGERGATQGNTDHGKSQHAAKAESTKAATAEMAEARPDPHSNAGKDNNHHSRALDGPQGAVAEAEPGGASHSKSGHSSSAQGANADERVATNGDTDHGKPQQVAHSGGGGSEPAQPAKAASDPGGADQQPVFRFDGEAAAATFVGSVDPQDHHNPHAAPGQEGLRAIVEMVPHGPDEHVVPLGHHGQHPGILPGSHDLLT